MKGKTLMKGYVKFVGENGAKMVKQLKKGVDYDISFVGQMPDPVKMKLMELEIDRLKKAFTDLAHAVGKYIPQGSRLEKQIYD